ncbi:zinc ABC transporter ATP-binding protein AztA [Embleya hyalina]|uniref:ABC transporter ATP-binding protein n=1 Tax=Embleya hyalina TaxID=516124 RepID=A0A401YSW6_9ACTN|nr:zinc ABC transporter ATP-binding protein AztA [Embleya hyalina]GCD97703.1 ABC transporter ATP-binding protein [Embleya hyalina]
MRPIHPPSEVTLRGISAGYPRRPVLHRLTAHIPRFATTAIVGPNGSGKSTLLGVLAGLLPVTAGSIERAGDSRPAFVMQRSAVAETLPLTVRETVAMGRWAHRGAWRRLTAHDRAVVDAALDRLGIADLAARQLGRLSGGQRQRALVAQGLAQEAELLLLDEPTTGLDVAARQRISDVLAESAGLGTTVVHVTHDLASARLADHCLLLHDGRLVAQGAPETVLTGATLRRVWGLPDSL